MKTIIHIEDGQMYLILTPEKNFESKIINEIKDDELDTVKMFKGEFSECRGGYLRHFQTEKQSLMIKIHKDKLDET